MVVVVFDSKRGRMLARVRPHLRSCGPIQDIGGAAVGTENQVAQPYNGRGRIVAFLAHPAASASNMAPAVVKVTYGRGTRFAAPQRVSPAGQNASDLAAAEGQGGEILAWIRIDPPSYAEGTVYAAMTDQLKNRLGAPQQVSPSEHVGIAVPTYSPSRGRGLLVPLVGGRLTVPAALGAHARDIGRCVGAKDLAFGVCHLSSAAPAGELRAEVRDSSAQLRRAPTPARGAAAGLVLLIVGHEDRLQGGCG